MTLDRWNGEPLRLLRLSRFLDLELDLERRRSGEVEDEIVVPARGELVVKAEAVFRTLREEGRWEGKDVLLDLEDTVFPALRSGETGGFRSGVDGVADAGEVVRVTTRRSGEEGEIGAGLNRLKRVLLRLAAALAEGVGGAEGRFAVEVDGEGVGDVGADALSDNAAAASDLPDVIAELERRTREGLDAPLGLEDVAGTELVLDAEELVGAGKGGSDVDVDVGLLSTEGDRSDGSAGAARGRSVDDGPRL